MKSFSIHEISLIKMSTAPPQEIVNCGMKIINLSDKYIYEWVGFGWIKTEKAEIHHYKEIPQLI